MDPVVPLLFSWLLKEGPTPALLYPLCVSILVIGSFSVGWSARDFLRRGGPYSSEIGLYDWLFHSHIFNIIRILNYYDCSNIIPNSAF